MAKLNMLPPQSCECCERPYCDGCPLESEEDKQIRKEEREEREIASAEREDARLCKEVGWM